MRKQIRYHATVDLKELRKIKLYTKQSVAERINYSVRTLERIEEENAVRDELTASILCDLYGLNFEEHFFEEDLRVSKRMSYLMAMEGNKPENKLIDDNNYYYIYIRKNNWGAMIVGSKLCWTSNYNRNKEYRIICKANADAIIERNPNITIINTDKEWIYWFYMLCVGKGYMVVVSEECMRRWLPFCLKEVLVSKKELFWFKGISDFYIF